MQRLGLDRSANIGAPVRDLPSGVPRSTYAIARLNPARVATEEISRNTKPTLKRMLS